jgi:hypothetical protein
VLLQDRRKCQALNNHEEAARSSQRVSQESHHHEVGSFAIFILVSCLAYSLTLKMEAEFFSETRVVFNGLHGITCQNKELFVGIYCCSNSFDCWRQAFILSIPSCAG